MTDYNEILDSEIDPNSPITTSLMTRLRDNLAAILEGAPGAPRMSPALLDIGGSESDGLLNNSFTASNPGFYDVTGGTRSSALSLPRFSVIRIKGNAVISSTLTVSSLSSAERTILNNFFNVALGRNGDDGTVGGAGDKLGSGGGGSLGDGGDGSDGGGLRAAGGTGYGSPGTWHNPWVEYLDRPLVGGLGGRATAGSTGTDGGGCVVILVDGDLDMTGGIIQADGADGTNTNDNTGGGGGAGSILVICTGTLTGGTYRARGGSGGEENSGANTMSGGGGGGRVTLVASAFAGSRTKTVTGGAGGDISAFPATDGTAGLAQEFTVTAEEIRGLIWR